MHVNDPFIFLITDVNHRKPMLPAPTACGELLVCMHEHMWYGEFHLSLSVSHPSHRLSVHIQAYAYGAAACLRLRHDTVVSRICYV